ncbi:hypothetical protein QN277_009870 [Acacia crassicarpa]|uniref:SWIM-type domain-containing protein n=1 Tax=Acacia crassicarpa TaxID=499986 RepID=A0AAE1IQN1_9FABA|nr:hypothetical protein QN277_009870 [Acacia crassicarpa]
MADKGKGIACSEEETGPVLGGKDEVLEINYLSKLRKISEVVSVEEETVRTFYIRSGHGENELDGDCIEELGEIDDLGDLNDLGRSEDIPLNQNAGETREYVSDIDDDSFMPQSLSESSESEDGLENDYEIHEQTEDSDEEEENLEYGGPVEERLRLSQLDGSERMPYFTVGMTFLDRVELRRAIDKYAIDNGVCVKIIRSEKKMVIATCQEGCPFRLYASRDSLGVGYILKTLVHEHMCARVYKNPRASVRWLAEHFKEKVQDNPQYSASEMKKEVERELKLFVSKYKCKRAKRRIMQHMEGSFVDEFDKLEAYCNELKVSNPGSDVSVELSPEALDQGRRVFRRMYVCFNASKVGWKLGCRPFIGLDGTFLKGRARGILLTAVGLDANDSMYPIAFGLTEKETNVNWTWFLESLKVSLELDEGGKVTIMSDMQKGLTQAVTSVLPLAEHRLCARHIYANWSKKWRGHELKKKFFTCAWSTYKEQFNDNLKAMEKVNKAAAVGAVSYPVNGWVRAYFTNRCLSMVVDNNVSESFNAWICECRYFPVIKMFDGIRLKLMEKWAASDNIVSTWKGNYSPKCLDLFDTNRYLAIHCRVFFNGDDGYEVVEGKDRHSVQLDRKMCTCRAWDLTGIPCQHAICAMYDVKVDPSTQISRYYHRETFLASYRTKFQPVRGQQFWETHKYHPLLPPPVCNLPGRPPTKRKRTEEAQRRRNISTATTCEAPDFNASATLRAEKLSKKGTVMRCSFCRKEGHNRSTCKEAPPSNNSHPGRKRRTPNPCGTSQQSSCPPSQQTPRTTNTSEPCNRSSKRTPARKVGFGILVDEDTGRTVYNPGLTSEQVIDAGTPIEFQHNANPQTRFAIPNEKEIRRSTPATLSSNEGSRKIDFSSATNSPMPVQPPGLQWNRQPSISGLQLRMQSQQIMSRRRSQLQQQRDQLITKNMPSSSK